MIEIKVELYVMQALTLVAPSGPLEQHGVVIGLVEVDESKERQRYAIVGPP